LIFIGEAGLQFNRAGRDKAGVFGQKWSLLCENRIAAKQKDRGGEETKESSTIATRIFLHRHREYNVW
jgi:hypothetical protein